MVAAPKPPKREKKARKPILHKSKRKAKKIIILDPDMWFSLCVRERAEWTCQKCGKTYEPWITVKGLPANQGLHCSHYIGRGNYSVRFEPFNADAHCYGCHQKFESNPHLFRLWKSEQLGPERYEILIEKSNDLLLGKQARREKREIAAHYKAEFERMRELRCNGKAGRINFQGYF